MPSDSRNLPEQEISIKSRAHEVFAKSEPAGPRRPTKPFPVYLRETPASPMSAAVKAGLWFTAIIVGLLFLAAVWKLTVRCGPGASRPTAGCASIKLHRQLPVGQPDSGFRGASNRARTTRGRFGARTHLYRLRLPADRDRCERYHNNGPYAGRRAEVHCAHYSVAAARRTVP